MPDGFPGAGEGGASAQGPSTGTTYKFGVKPGQGANREDIGGKKKKGKHPPTFVPSEQPSERTRPRRKK